MMCGRYTLTNPTQAVSALFGLEVPADAADYDHFTTPRFNIAPTQAAPVLCMTENAPGPNLRVLRWGLIPPWAKTERIGARLINARAETVDTKPAFKGPFTSHRCLIPADGFFEWRRRAPGVKQPYWIGMKHRAPFAFGGVWAHWRGPDATVIESFSIITRPPNTLVSVVHDRMPAIISAGSIAAWLDPRTTRDDLLGILALPIAAEGMEMFPVSSKVNRPSNDDASCVQPVEPDSPTQGSLGL